MDASPFLELSALGKGACSLLLIAESSFTSERLKVTFQRSILEAFHGHRRSEIAKRSG